MKDGGGTLRGPLLRVKEKPKVNVDLLGHLKGKPLEEGGILEPRLESANPVKSAELGRYSPGLPGSTWL